MRAWEWELVGSWNEGVGVGASTHLKWGCGSGGQWESQMRAWEWELVRTSNEGVGVGASGHLKWGCGSGGQWGSQMRVWEWWIVGISNEGVGALDSADLKWGCGRGVYGLSEMLVAEGWVASILNVTAGRTGKMTQCEHCWHWHFGVLIEEKHERCAVRDVVLTFLVVGLNLKYVNLRCADMIPSNRFWRYTIQCRLTQFLSMWQNLKASM